MPMHDRACGILAHDFARARCAQCGHGYLIASRATATVSAPIVQDPSHGGDGDHVLPRPPLRMHRHRYFRACTMHCLPSLHRQRQSRKSSPPRCRTRTLEMGRTGAGHDHIAKPLACNSANDASETPSGTASIRRSRARVMATYPTRPSSPTGPRRRLFASLAFATYSTALMLSPLAWWTVFTG
jgi:hypothetical protein